jgi:RNA polymerase sigma-70 factor (ECF subfamily)
MTAAADVPVRPISAGVAEAARPGMIPIVGGPLAGPVLGGGGRGAGANDWLDGAVRDDGRSRELPETLVVGAVRGDDRARAELLALIHPLVLRYCRARLGRQESVLRSAEDVAQDVCMAVLAALRSYQPKGLSFRAFVFGIASHKVTDVFRAGGRDRTEPVAELPDNSVTTDGPEDRLLAAERSERLRALLAYLTPRQREILVLRVAVGVSAQEAAQAVGSTAGTVRVTQHRALARLRQLLQEGAASAPPIADSAPDDAADEGAPQ